jgi:hypothetical protein
MCTLLCSRRPAWQAQPSTVLRASTVLHGTKFVCDCNLHLYKASRAPHHQHGIMQPSSPIITTPLLLLLARPSSRPPPRRTHPALPTQRAAAHRFRASCFVAACKCSYGEHPKCTHARVHEFAVGRTARGFRAAPAATPGSPLLANSRSHQVLPRCGLHPSPDFSSAPAFAAEMGPPPSTER